MPRFETCPAPYRRLRALRARSVPGVSDRVSPKIRVSEGVSGGVSRGPSGPRAPECPKGVPRVSPECPGHLVDTPDTLGTPFGHSGARGPEGPRDTRPDTPSDTLIFGDTLSKMRPPPPPEKSVNFDDFLLICTVFLILSPFRGGG